MINVEIRQNTTSGRKHIAWTQLETLPSVGQHIHYGCELEIKKIIHHLSKDLGRVSVTSIEIVVE